MTPAPRIGTEFAGYRIEGLIARGGMGVVYRAEHPRLGATVALKVMDPELGADEAFRERFVREARAAARVRHPNIVPIYDAGEWQGDLYIAMGYIEGDDLRTMLRKRGPVPPEHATWIGAQIASALDAAHRRGLVHRDVKPGNILIEPGPEPDAPPVAYLADLGLTKQVDSRTGVTESGALVGTIDYMAPEQIKGSRVDSKVDIYALACVLFECLTGSVPYPRENQAAVIWGHLNDEVPRASTANPALPPGVDAALARGMAKAPENRFATARELVEAVGGPLDAPTAFAPSTPQVRASPTAVSESTSGGEPRRSWRNLALAIAVGALLGATGAVGVVLLVSDRDGTPTDGTADADTGETTPAGGITSLNPFEQELSQYVPDELRPTCRPAPPLSADFDATLSCRPGNTVSSVTYSHARSGFVLHNFFLSGMPRASLTVPSSGPIPSIGLCSTGAAPALNAYVPVGLQGRQAVTGKVAREERIGFVRCYERGDRAQIDWTTSELGVYAAAKGESLDTLYEWWRTEAGPQP
jgi:serine/threonine protein kinase